MEDIKKLEEIVSSTTCKVEVHNYIARDGKEFGDNKELCELWEKSLDIQAMVRFNEMPHINTDNYSLGLDYSDDFHSELFLVRGEEDLSAIHTIWEHYNSKGWAYGKKDYEWVEANYPVPMIALFGYGFDKGCFEKFYGADSVEFIHAENYLGAIIDYYKDNLAEIGYKLEV